MEKAVPEKTIAEIDHRVASDPKFAEYVEEVTDQFLPLVLARAREIARELALFGVCATQIVTDVDWTGMLRGKEDAVGAPKLQLIDPKRIAFINDLPKSPGTSSKAQK